MNDFISDAAERYSEKDVDRAGEDWVNPEPEFEYIAYSQCGCVVGMIADSPGSERATGRFLIDAVREGMTVRRVRRDSEEFQLACRNLEYNCLKGKE